MLRHALYCPLSSINTTDCWRNTASEALEAKRLSNDRCAPTLGTRSPWPSATFQDFALGMFSFWCGRKQRNLLYMGWARNIKFAVGNVRNFHFLLLFICLSEPILSCSSCLFKIKPCFSSRLTSATIKTSFFILSSSSLCFYSPSHLLYSPSLLLSQSHFLWSVSSLCLNPR